MRPRCSSAPNLDGVVLGLFQANPFQPSGWDPVLQTAPNSHGDIFGGAQQILEPSHVAVQVPMVDIMDDQVLHNPVDVLQIDHHARTQVNRSANGHLELVVVAVVPGTCPAYL